MTQLGLLVTDCITPPLLRSNCCARYSNTSCSVSTSIRKSTQHSQVKRTENLRTISHTNFNLPTVLVTVQKQLSFVLSMTFSQLLMPTKFLSSLSLICWLLLTPLTTLYCCAIFNNILVFLVWPSAGSSHTCQTGFSLFLQAAVTPSYLSLIIGCHKGRC